MSRIDELKAKYYINDVSLLTMLLRRYSLSDSINVSDKNAFIPDGRYVELIRSRLDDLNGIIRDSSLKEMRAALEDEICTDQDDKQELMEHIHSRIALNVYGCIEKVKAEDIDKLLSFLQAIYYYPVDVRAGDDLEEYVDYFKDTFPQPDSTGVNHNKIFYINKQPYKIEYSDGDENNSLVLKGVCKFYK